MNDLYNVYADLSCSSDSFVMSAPLDILVSVFKMHERATKRVIFETSQGTPSTLSANYGGLFLNRFNQVVFVKAVR